MSATFRCAQCARSVRFRPGGSSPSRCPHCNAAVVDPVDDFETGQTWTLETGETRALAATMPRAEGQLSLTTGDVVSGRFHIVRKLGSGGMGEVFEAEDTEVGSTVAIKVVRPEVVDTEDVADRLRREVQLARDVTHPNVCRTFDLYRHTLANGVEVTVVGMELLKGEDLAHRIARGALTVREALPILRQIARGLFAAHRLGIVHRDLKPSNVLLVPESDGIRAVVTDFGIARRTTENSAEINITQTGFALGSPAYMAPEQLAGEPITPATDVYALGLVAHEMITGTSPFADTTPWLAVTKRLSEPPIDVEAEVPGLDPRYPAFVARCLEREPKDRFGDMEEVLRFLDFGDRDWEAYGRKQQVEDRGLRRSGPRDRRLMVGMAAAGLLAFAVVVSAWIRLGPSSTSTAPGESELTASPSSRAEGAINSDGGAVADPDAGGQVEPVPDRIDAPGAMAASESSELPSEAATPPGRRPTTETVGLESALSRASEALARHDGAVALEILDPWWRRHADSARVLIRMADAQAMLGQSKLALRTAERAMTAAAGLDREARLAVESRYEALGPDWARASDLARSVWTLHPERLDLGLDAADALLRAGAIDEAQRAIDTLRAQPGAGEEPRIDLLEARWADAVANNEVQIAAARRAAERTRAMPAPILLAEARLLEASARRRLGDLDTAEAVAKAALEIGKAHNHDRLRADAETAFSGIALERGSVDAALSGLDDASSRYETLGHPAGQVRALGLIGSAYRTQGKAESSRAQLTRAIEIGTSAGLPVATNRVRRRLAGLARQLGAFDEALSLTDQTLAFHRQAGNEHGIAHAQIDRAAILLQLGSIRPALEAASAAEAVFVARESERGLTEVAVLRASASLAAGRVADALTATDQALRAEPAAPLRFQALVERGRALLLRGDASLLEATLDDLDTVAQQLREPRYLAAAAWLRARADLQAGNGKEAVRRLTRWLRPVDLNDPTLRARLELTAAEAYVLRDRHALAKTALGRAEVLLRQVPDQAALWRQEILAARADSVRNPRGALNRLMRISRRATDAGLLMVAIEARMTRALLIGDRSSLDRLTAMASQNGLSAVADAAKKGEPCVACF